ncbi:MAG: Clp protease ClpP, partial [Nitrospirota bacterium]|nr:Clp protease ClpP [Nitrospirota bacterium]
MKELLIYSDIGEGFFEEGITTAFVKGELDSAGGEDITVRINSAGGDVFEGLGIYNVLDQYPGNVSVFVDGLAASAASVIAMAGAEIYMAENALMMIHDPYTMAVGSAQDMRETADLLDKVKGSIVTTYLGRSSESEESIS